MPADHPFQGREVTLPGGDVTEYVKDCGVKDRVQAKAAIAQTTILIKPPKLEPSIGGTTSDLPIQRIACIDVYGVQYSVHRNRYTLWVCVVVTFGHVRLYFSGGFTLSSWLILRRDFAVQQAPVFKELPFDASAWRCQTKLTSRLGHNHSLHG